jgi:type II secretory pathway pseudopilin PulG
MYSIKFKKLQKAAMFGLDARIALAIFGALSIISGAALYKVIDDVKAAQYLQVFKSLAKASEQYYLDNGQPLLKQTLLTNGVYSGDLMNNREGLDTWKGPYIQSMGLSANLFNMHTDGAIFGVEAWSAIMLYPSSDWASPTACVSSDDCAEWLKINFDDAEERAVGAKLFAKLDTYVDNNDGAATGSVRYIEVNATTHTFYFRLRLRREM